MVRDPGTIACIGPDVANDHLVPEARYRQGPGSSIARERLGRVVNGDAGPAPQPARRRTALKPARPIVVRHRAITRPGRRESRVGVATERRGRAGALVPSFPGPVAGAPPKFLERRDARARSSSSENPAADFGPSTSEGSRLGDRSREAGARREYSELIGERSPFGRDEGNNLVKWKIEGRSVRT